MVNKTMKKLILLAALLLACGIAAAQEAALSTNVLGYVNLGTMNVEASYGVARHWSINLGMQYNPFTFDGNGEADTMQNRRQAYAIGARFWPWHIYSGWWMAGKMQYQEYNTGGITSPVTTEGDRLGAGLSGGYTYMLGRHFNFEVGVGLWTGYDIYTRYACPRCGRTIGKGEGIFVLPNDIMLSLSYVF